MTSSVSHAWSKVPFWAAREPSGTPARYFPVASPWASTEKGDATDPLGGEHVQEVVFDPAVEQGVGRLVDEQRHAESPQDRRGLLRHRCRVGGDADIEGLAGVTAEARAPMVSSSGVSGSKRWE